MTEQIKYNIGNGHEISVEYDEYNITKITKECFEMLIEKEIPIKPIGKNNVCPKCGVIEFGFNEPNYCEWCGQKLDWGNENDRY